MVSKSTIFVIGAAALLYLGGIAATEGGRLAHSLTSLDWLDWSVILSLSLVNYGLRFLRWYGYLGILGMPRYSLRRYLAIYIAGFALTVTPGKAGEVLRSALLKPYGVSWNASLAALFVERVADVIVLFGLGLLCLGLVTGGMHWLLACIALLFLCMWALYRQWPRKLAIVFGNHVRLTAIRRLCLLIARMFRQSAVLLYNRYQPSSLLIGLLAWGAEGIGLYIILDAIAPAVTTDIGILTITGIYAASLLAGTLAFLPGGIGGTEAAMTALLTAAGFHLDTAMLATILCRLATLWFAVAIGGLTLLFLPQDRHDPRNPQTRTVHH